MANVLIAGGSGLIGQRLSQLLKDKGHQVLVLSRKENLQADPPRYRWNIPKQFVDPKALQKADYLINLAGTGIADARWSRARKRSIIDSRVDSTLLLLKALQKEGKNPKAYIAATAIGYYGERGDSWVDEDSAPGENGFLPEVCVQWEDAAKRFENSGIRTTIIRVGIVLSTRGGALQKMLPSYQLRTGAYFGDGSQYYSWIHLDDLCRIFIAAVEEDDFSGIFNGVSPNPLPNKQLAKDIGKALNKPALVVPVPEFGLRLTMGEMADVVLVGSRVSAQKLLDRGFQFAHPELIPAVRDLVARKL